MCGDGDFNRREFVRLGLAGVGAGFIGGVGLPDLAFAANGAGKTLIWIDMAGGSDGLHLFPPISGSNRSAYEEARGPLAIEAPGTSVHAALPLTTRWGVNPNLAPLLPLWDAGKMAVCIGTGGDYATMSHFDAQRWIRLGVENRVSGRGLLGGYLVEQKSGAGVLRGLLSGGPNMRVSFQGGPPIPAINTADSFKIRNDDWCAGTGCSDNKLTAALTRVADDMSSGVANAKEADILMRTRAVERAMAESLDMVKDAAAAYPGPTTNGYSAFGLGASLKLIAQLLKKGAPLEVAGVNWWGAFDMHAGLVPEGGIMYNAQNDSKFNNYSRGLYFGAKDLKVFCDEMGPEAMKNIVIVVSTEFGRRIGANGGPELASTVRGTDHGMGASWIVIGGGVKGGIYGDEPQIDIAALKPSGKQWVDAVMPITVNYKDVIGEIMVKHLNFDQNLLSRVFPNRPVGFKNNNIIS